MLRKAWRLIWGGEEGWWGVEIRKVGSLFAWIWRSKHEYLEKEITQRVNYVFLDGFKFTGRRLGLLPGDVNLCCGPSLFRKSGSLSLTFHLIQIIINYQLALKTIWGGESCLETPSQSGTTLHLPKGFDIIILPECIIEVILLLTCLSFYKVGFRISPGSIRGGHPNQFLSSFICSHILRQVWAWCCGKRTRHDHLCFLQSAAVWSDRGDYMIVRLVLWQGVQKGTWPNMGFRKLPRGDNN